MLMLICQYAGAAARVCCSAASCRAQTLIDLQPDLRRRRPVTWLTRGREKARGTARVSAGRTQRYPPTSPEDYGIPFLTPRRQTARRGGFSFLPSRACAPVRLKEY